MQINIPISIKIPRSWNELTEKQLQGVALLLEHFHGLTEKTKNNQNVRARLYIHLIRQLVRANSMLKTWIALKQILPQEYLQHLQFLFKTNTRTTFPQPFKIKTGKVFPPAARLQNLTMEEFSFADSLYYHWRDKNDDRYLDLLCATLYRPFGGTDPEIDQRKPFRRSLIETVVPHFHNLLRGQKLAIAYAYEGSRNYIVGQYPTVFPKAEAPTEAEAAAPKKPYAPFGQLIHYKIQFDTGKLRETETLNVHKFLSIYENELKDLKKQKQYGQHA